MFLVYKSTINTIMESRNVTFFEDVILVKEA
jgi:sRNA-binding regulator protein Hfq